MNSFENKQDWKYFFSDAVNEPEKRFEDTISDISEDFLSEKKNKIFVFDINLKNMAAMKTPSPADLLSFLSLLEDLDQPPVVELLYNEKAPVMTSLMMITPQLVPKIKFYYILKQRVDHTCVRVLEKVFHQQQLEYQIPQICLSLKLSFVLW